MNATTCTCKTYPMEHHPDWCYVDVTVEQSEWAAFETATLTEWAKGIR